MSARPLAIDVHTHVIPEHWPSLQERYGYGGWVQLEHTGHGCARLVQDGVSFREITANSWSPERRFDDLSRTGVDVQVLSTVPVMFSYWARAQDALDLGRRLNDHIAGLVQQHPRRFVGLGTLPLQDPELAMRELERCVRELGLAGIEIGSHVNGRNLDDPGVVDVLAAAEQLGAAVLVHPWDMLGRERMERYWLPWLIGMPTETALAICCMIFGGVFEKLPRLRVCFAHGGGAFPAAFGRIERGFQVRPDLFLQSRTDPRSFLGRFYVDSLVHDPELLRYLIQLLGERSIALGSDYPFPLGEEHPGELIRSLGLSPASEARLLHGSALEWLGLDAERFR